MSMVGYGILLVIVYLIAGYVVWVLLEKILTWCLKKLESVNKWFKK